MLPFYRYSLFKIFALFFILVTPFLAIYSLGYNANFQDVSLGNTLSLTIETYPGSAQTYVGNEKVLDNNGDLKAKDGTLVPIKIEKDGYLTENFSVYGKAKQNSIAKLTPLYLLPNNPTNTSKTNGTVVGILSDNLALIKKDGNYYVQSFNFSGFYGDLTLVTSDLVGGDVPVSRFEALTENSYWSPSDQVLLARDGLSLRLVKINTFHRIQSLARLNGRYYAALDDNGMLWKLDAQTGQFEYVANNIDGMAFTLTPDNIWLWQGEHIYKIDRSQPFDATTNFDTNRAYTNNHLLEQNFDSVDSQKQYPFMVRNVFQGMLFKIGTETYYVPDYDQTIWQKIASNVEIITTDTNSIFWINTDGDLYSYNIFDQFEQYLSKVDKSSDFREMSLQYYNNWKRLFVYSPKKVYSVAYNKDDKTNVPTAAVITYNPTLWITDSYCREAIYDRTQFCLHDNNLTIYRNPFITPFF